jgi:outer membrane protein TolC
MRVDRARRAPQLPNRRLRLRIRNRRFVAVAALACAGRAAGAQAAGLDLERAVALALQRNERAAQAGARHAAAAARVDRARAFFFPDLVATGIYTRRAHPTVRSVDGGETITRRSSLQGVASMSLALFDARSIPLYRAAARDADAARLEASEERRRIGFEAADAYLVTIGTEQVRVAAERRLEYAQRSLQDARGRLDAGLVGSNDVTRAELEVATAARALADARAAAETAYLELGNLLDAEIESPLVTPEALLDSAATLTVSAESHVEAAQRRRLDVAARRERAAAAHIAAQEPLLRTLPRFDLEAETRISNERIFSGYDDDWALSLSGTWDLFDGGERYAERDERRALAAVADLDTRALLRGVDLDVRGARVTLEQSQAAMRAAAVAVDAARRNAAETSELYRQGLTRALEVSDAGVRLFEAEVGLATERFGLGRAFLDWRAALGLDPLGREP